MAVNPNLPKVIVEKRRHRMLVTRNTEYHLRDDVCVGIRRLDSGDWIAQSKALGARLFALLSDVTQTLCRAGASRFPEVGDHLIFTNAGGNDVITTAIQSVGRPPREVLKYYLKAN